MPRVYKQVYTYNVQYVCDECGKGLMEHTGMCLMSNPVQYPHKCSECGFTENMKNRYPHVDYKDTPEVVK